VGFALEILGLELLLFFFEHQFFKRFKNKIKITHFDFIMTVPALKTL